MSPFQQVVLWYNAHSDGEHLLDMPLYIFLSHKAYESNWRVCSIWMLTLWVSARRLHLGCGHIYVQCVSPTQHPWYYAICSTSSPCAIQILRKKCYMWINFNDSRNLKYMLIKLHWGHKKHFGVRILQYQKCCQMCQQNGIEYTCNNEHRISFHHSLGFQILVLAFRSLTAHLPVRSLQSYRNLVYIFN